MNNEKATDNQIDFLLKYLRRTGGIEKHFDLSNAYELINGISEKQYKWLINEATVMQINGFLINKKLKQNV